MFHDSPYMYFQVSPVKGEWFFYSLRQKGKLKETREKYQLYLNPQFALESLSFCW